MEDKVLLPLFLLSLAVMFFLLGDLSSFIVVVIAVLLVSLVCSLVRVKALSPALPFVIKDSVFVLSFSALVALIFAVVLPYLLFHNYFLNIYVIQYIYVFPVLFVFFLAVHWFNCFVKGEMPDYKHMIKLSFVIALVFSLVLSVVMIGVSNYLYDTAAQDRSNTYDAALPELNKNMQNISAPDLPVFKEIIAYNDDTLAAAKQQNAAFKEFSSSKGLCIGNSCVHAMADELYGLTVLVVRSMIATGVLRQANNESALINSGEIERNYISLDNYLTLLKGKFDSMNFTITEPSKYDLAAMRLADSDFTPDDIKYLYETSGNQETSSVPPSLLEPVLLFESNSLFYNSLSYSAEHSTVFKELCRLVLKIFTYTGKQGENLDLITVLYGNRDMKEPIKSKVIRYRILLNYAEQKAKRTA